MAANTKSKGGSTHPTISFTLPISCQICLGKVKEPVVCPNQHVFCRVCMDVWLSRSQHCPACRVTISNDVPYKPIIGGLNQQMEDPQSNPFLNKELRQARTQLLFKEYESAIEQAQMEVVSLKRKNEELEQQLRERPVVPPVNKFITTQHDVMALSSLTHKLSDATVLYESVKADVKKLKRENALLQDQNENFKHETNHLRSELVSRSPRKFGRFTVAALESKLESYAREVNQLQRALERSDAHIAEMNTEMTRLRAVALRRCSACRTAQLGTDTATDKNSLRDSHLGTSNLTDNLLDDSNLDNNHLDDSNLGNSNLNVDLDDTATMNEDDVSFRLEMPSPVTQNRTAEKSHVMLTSEIDNSCCKKKLHFSKQTLVTTNEEVVLPNRCHLPNQYSHADMDSSDDKQQSINLDQSVDCDVDDCLKLLDAAEKRHQHMTTTTVRPSYWQSQ